MLQSISCKQRQMFVVCDQTVFWFLCCFKWDTVWCLGHIELKSDAELAWLRDTLYFDAHTGLSWHYFAHNFLGCCHHLTIYKNKNNPKIQISTFHRWLKQCANTYRALTKSAFVLTLISSPNKQEFSTTNWDTNGIQQSRRWWIPIRRGIDKRLFCPLHHEETGVYLKQPYWQVCTSGDCQPSEWQGVIDR